MSAHGELARLGDACSLGGTGCRTRFSICSGLCHRSRPSPHRSPCQRTSSTSSRSSRHSLSLRSIGMHGNNMAAQQPSMAQQLPSVEEKCLGQEFRTLARENLELRPRWERLAHWAALGVVRVLLDTVIIVTATLPHTINSLSRTLVPSLRTAVRARCAACSRTEVASCDYSRVVTTVHAACYSDTAACRLRLCSFCCA
jgi:hypothetical protein